MTNRPATTRGATPGSDLNPIEQLFTKIKHWPRKAQMRTADAVCDVIGQILADLTPQECANYFINAGYDPT